MVDDFSQKSSTILILYCDLYYLNFYLIHFLNSFFSKNSYISTDNIKEYLVLVVLSNNIAHAPEVLRTRIFENQTINYRMKWAQKQAYLSTHKRRRRFDLKKYITFCFPLKLVAIFEN